MASSRKRPSAHDVTVTIDCVEQAIVEALRCVPDASASVHSSARPSAGTLATSGTSSGTPSTIAIALSGGLDSTVLLDAAVAVVGPQRCVAIHVHHGLSAHADEWLRRCEAACRQRAVRFVSESVRLQAVSKRGVEAAAREARYEALARLAAACGVQTILLGQHADDQAETVLLQLLRGAGLPGLAAMPYQRSLGRRSDDDRGALPDTISSNAIASPSSMWLLRPFLAIDRTVLEAYANARRLDWITDESNTDVRYARNALRRDVMPSIERYFPGYRHTLARAARHAAQAQQLCDELAAIDLQALTLFDDDGERKRAIAGNVDDRNNGDTNRPDAAEAVEGRAATWAISRAALRGLSASRASNVLRYWMRQQGLPAASEARLGDMCRQLCAAPRVEQSGASMAGGGGGIAGMRQIPVEIHHAGRVLRTYRDKAMWVEADSLTPHAVVQRDHTAMRNALGASFSAVAGGAAECVYEGGSVWSLPDWHGELRITALDGRAPASADANTDASTDASADACVAGCAIDVDARALEGATLSARARTGGERLRTAASRPTRSLKHLFQAAGIAPWQRNVPNFYLNGSLFFVPTIGGYLPASSDPLWERTTAAHGEDARGLRGVVGADNRRIRLCWVSWK